jgi:hypothetical protein
MLRARTKIQASVSNCLRRGEPGRGEGGGCQWTRGCAAALLHVCVHGWARKLVVVPACACLFSMHWSTSKHWKRAYTCMSARECCDAMSQGCVPVVIQGCTWVCVRNVV